MQTPSVPSSPSAGSSSATPTSQAANSNQAPANLPAASEACEADQNGNAVEIAKGEGELISRPEFNGQSEATLEAGRGYIFDFVSADVASFIEKNGDLEITFVCGGTLTLKNYTAAAMAANPAHFVFADGAEGGGLAALVQPAATVEVEPGAGEEDPQSELRDGDQSAESQEQAQEVAKTEPSADEMAAKVAEIEPAAGDTGAGSRASAGGYGFASTFDPTPVDPLRPIGALGATALQYGAEFPVFEVSPPEEIVPSAPDANPEVGEESHVDVDETNLKDGPQVVSGVVVADFGSDGRGTIEFDGSFNFTGTPGEELTSCGQPVTVNFDAETNTFAGVDAQGNTIFTLVMDPATGEYTFTLFGALDHADPGNPDDIINFTFGVVVTDADGDSETTIVTVGIADDGPFAAGAEGSIDETDAFGAYYGNQDPSIVRGGITVDFGADGEGSVQANGDVQIGGAVGENGLTSGGEPVEIMAVDGGYVGMTKSGGTIFTLTIDPETGEYVFHLLGPLDHADSTGSHEIINLTFGVTVTDCDGDSVTTSITIHVSDDGPSAYSAFNVVNESALDEGGVITFTQTLAHDFGADADGEIAANGTIVIMENGHAVTELTSGGQAVSITVAGGGYVGTLADGTVVFTVVMNPETGTYVYTQYLPFDHVDAGTDSVLIRFGFSVIDGDGDSVQVFANVNIVDDVPHANNDSNFAEDDVVVTGNVVDNDDAGGDGNGHVASVEIGGQIFAIPTDGSSVTITGQYGTLTINAAGEYSYEPFQDAEGTDIFTYTFADGDGDTTTATLTVGSTAEDVPLIAVIDAQNVDETNLAEGPVVVSGVVNAGYGDDAPGAITVNGQTGVSGSIGENGLTSCGQPVTITAVDDGTYVGTTPDGAQVFILVVNPATGEYTFTLLGPLDHADGGDPDDVISISFGIVATDSDGDQSHSGITINIADDGPVAQDDTDSVVGTVFFTDGNVFANDDIGEDVAGHPVTSVVFNGVTYDIPAGGAVTITGQYGVLTIDSDGNYTYEGFNGADGVDEFVYTITDCDGDQASATLTITVSTDDQPGTDPVPQPQFVDETALQNGPVVVDGTVGVNFGDDVPGAITPDGDVSVSGSVGENGLTSCGQPVTIEAVDGGYVGTAPDGTVIFTLTIDPATGEYTFTLLGAIDHADGSDPNDMVTINFGVVATDADGDSVSTTIIVNISDDAPAIENAQSTGDEDALVAAGVVYVEGVVAHNFGADGVGSIAPTGNFAALYAEGGPSQNLTSGGQAVTVGATADGYVGVLSDGTVVFQLMIDPQTGEYVYQQFLPIDHPDAGDNNEPIWMQFEIQITDCDGDTQNSVITIDLRDSGPVAQGDSNNVTDEGSLLIDGNVFANDEIGADAVDRPVTAVTFNGVTYDVPETGTITITGQYGVLTIGAGGEYTYEAFEGAEGIDEFVYTVTDADGDTSSATLSITVSTDDVPVVTPPQPQAVDETNLAGGPISVGGQLDIDYDGDDAGGIAPNGNFNASGSVAGGQLTSCGVPVVVTQLPDGSYIGMAGDVLVFTLAMNTEGAYEFTLYAPLDHADPNNPNDVIRLAFGFTVTDADGDATNAVITIDVADDVPVAHNDVNVFDFNDGTASGNVITGENGGDGAADDGGVDGAPTVTGVDFGGTHYDVPEGGSVTIAGEYGALEMHSDGSYTYTLYDTNGSGGETLVDEFTYQITDCDGDFSSATLDLQTVMPESVLIVGSNANDVEGQSGPHIVGGGTGEIGGGAGGDILVGDNGGASIENQEQDYNFLFILDVSGSMGSPNNPNSRLSLLIDAVQSLINDLGEYENGEIMVHFTLFSTNYMGGETFVVTDPSDLIAAVQWLEGLNSNSFTNYEAGLQEGIAWLQGDEPLDDAINIAYFISDGLPNSYIDAQGNVVSQSDSPNSWIVPMQEITGSDGTNEVAILQSLCDEVIGVGINIGDPNIQRLDVIDSDHDAINVDDPHDLTAILAETNPLNRFAAVGDDHIVGGDGNDIIFGDVLYTDDLAALEGLGDLGPGAGWAVFAALESGQGNTAGWDRQDTIDYIRAHAEQLARESVNSEGEGRLGGDDILDGGAGDDLIFGQEGNDIIIGGAGDDILFGGSGDDVFVFQSMNDGVDTIMDFETGDLLDISSLLIGYDPLQDSINDFVFTTEVNGNTIVYVDASGSGDIANATMIATLDGVTGLNIEDITNNGQHAVV